MASHEASQDGLDFVKAESSEVYKAIPLISQHSVRLFTLRPAEPGKEFILEADVHVAQLDDAKDSFAALSYTWGPPVPASYIHINGLVLPITNSLYQFLLELRHAGITSPLWADAICINQGSNVEKNHQVPLMSAIYSFATHIRSWLGKSLHDVAECMQAYNDSQDLHWEVEPLRSRQSDATGILDRLLQHPYWTRTWILQEVILAKVVKVHCCSSVLNWEAFVRMTKRLCAKVGMKYLQKVGQSGLMHLNEERTSQSPRTLPALLRKHRATECIDRHDRVFALVGLINMDDDPLHHVAIKIDGQATPTHWLDYSLPLPVLLIHLLTFYGRTATDVFASDLWEAFDLDHYKFSAAQLNMHVQVPIHVTLDWKIPLIKRRCGLPLHQIPNMQRGKWLITGYSRFEETDGSIRLIVCDSDHERGSFATWCHLYAYDPTRVNDKSVMEKWIPLSEDAHAVLSNSILNYRRLPGTTQCGCYVEMSISKYILLRKCFISAFSTNRKSRPVTLSRSNLHIKTSLEDVMNDYRRQVGVVETAMADAEFNAKFTKGRIRELNDELAGLRRGGEPSEMQEIMTLQIESLRDELVELYAQLDALQKYKTYIESLADRYRCSASDKES